MKRVVAPLTDRFIVANCALYPPEEEKKGVIRMESFSLGMNWPTLAMAFVIVAAGGYGAYRWWVRQ